MKMKSILGISCFILFTLFTNVSCNNPTTSSTLISSSSSLSSSGTNSVFPLSAVFDELEENEEDLKTAVNPSSQLLSITFYSSMKNNIKVTLSTADGKLSSYLNEEESNIKTDGTANHVSIKLNLITRQSEIMVNEETIYKNFLAKKMAVDTLSISTLRDSDTGVLMVKNLIPDHDLQFQEQTFLFDEEIPVVLGVEEVGLDSSDGIIEVSFDFILLSTTSGAEYDAFVIQIGHS